MPSWCSSFETAKSISFFPKVCAVLLALFTEAGAMLSSAPELTKQPLETNPLLRVTTRHLQKASSNIWKEWLVLLEKPVWWPGCLPAGNVLVEGCSVTYICVVFNSLSQHQVHNNFKVILLLLKCKELEGSISRWSGNFKWIFCIHPDLPLDMELPNCPLMVGSSHLVLN